jgi:AraC-like DNA-binding protein
MFKEILLEIPPLSQNDCFTLSSKTKDAFTYPLHYHEELELNLILNAAGAQRVIGDHMGEIGDAELVLTGPNLPHGWFTHNCVNTDIHEVTIQFNAALFPPGILQKNQLIHIRTMFQDAKRGLLFSKEMAQQLSVRILALDKKTGFDSVLELLSIFHDLSVARNSRMLSNISFTKESHVFNSRRIERVFEFLHRNFEKKITLSDVARIAHMSDGSFSRFIKIHTGHSFTENLIGIRLGHVSRMLINTSYSVNEIANKSGFQNMANFNKIFRERKGCSPKEFKQKYVGKCVFI